MNKRREPSAARWPLRSGRGWTGDVQPCVWMAAGLVAYRMCDRDFDCEHCPLDAGLRGAEAPRERPEQPAGGAWEFPDDRRYHPAHTWALDHGGDRMGCGLDAFAASLLRSARGVVLPVVGTQLRVGQVAWWMSDANHLVPLRSPVSGRIVERNRGLADGATCADAPYDEGWTLKIQRSRPADRLLSATHARERADRHWRAFHQRAAVELAGSAGPTRPDGGERLTDLRRILGLERYYELLSGFLC